MTKRVVLIGGRFDVCDRARVLGAEVILVQKPALSDEKANSLAKTVILTNYDSDSALEGIMRAIHESDPIDAIISLTEHGLRTAAKLAHTLGLPGMEHPDIVELTFDKYAMRQASHLPDSVRVRAMLGEGLADLESFATSNGFPFIVKPRAGAGSRGVFLVASVEDFKDIPTGGEFLMEEFLDGPEFSVEAFSFNGRHVIFAITQHILSGPGSPNPYVEAGHLMPADIDADTKRAIEETVLEFLTAFGVMDGPTHTELKITKNGHKIIETHSRYGGDHIGEMVHLVTGVDMISMCIGWRLGLAEELHEAPATRRGAAVRFIHAEVGKVKAVHGVETARKQPGISIVQAPEVGAVVQPVLGSADRCGFVVAVDDRSRLAAQACDDAIALITITV